MLLRNISDSLDTRQRMLDELASKVENGEEVNLVRIRGEIGFSLPACYRYNLLQTAERVNVLRNAKYLRHVRVYDIGALSDIRVPGTSEAETAEDEDMLNSGDETSAKTLTKNMSKTACSISASFIFAVIFSFASLVTTLQCISMYTAAYSKNYYVFQQTASFQRATVFAVFAGFFMLAAVILFLAHSRKT